MNEADPSPINLDELRLLPDWLREEGPPPAKQYASHDGGGDDAGPRRGSRPGSFDRDRRDGRGFGGGGGGGDRRRDSGRRSGPPPRGGTGHAPRDDRRAAPPAPVLPAPVRVEFLPDEKCLVSINKQIRTSHMAYPLFGLARMFLQEPARHWVQFTVITEAAAAGVSLFQLGEEGPVTLDRAVLERNAFDAAKDRFYKEQTEQKEPPKGNYTSVARNRLSGTLLGPTNYHGYQPALRAEYERGFSRRMSFEDYRRNIEVVSDPALVERWKEEARTTTTITTLEGEPPTVLQTESDARAHFRQHHLDTLLRANTTFKVHGSVARGLPEPAMMQAIRQANEAELRYPAQFVQLLRQGLQNSGLHIFKHRKRVVYVSLARPTSFAPDGAVSENVAAILEIVAQFPLCTRKVLAEKLLARKSDPDHKPPVLTKVTADAVPGDIAPSSTPGAVAFPEPMAAEEPAGEFSAVVPPSNAGDASSENNSAPVPMPPALEAILAANPAPPATDDPMAKAKAALAADLRFLVQAGHLIEFHNGTFDLPLPPKAKEEAPAAAPAQKPGNAQPEEMTDAEPTAIATDAVAVEAERALITVESMTILPAETLPEAEAIPLISGLEKIDAQELSASNSSESPATLTPPPLGAPANPVVIGDVESAHPLSPS